jgi:uncharacterized membrane protein
MQVTAVLESLFRWIHVVAGVLWIGLLYFFNFVNSAFAPTLDADAKRKVVPELMPRALYWFRMGAAWTWVTGVLLLFLVFYHGGVAFADPAAGWGVATIVMVAFTFLAPFVYDALMKSLGKTNLKAAVAVGFLVVAAAVYLFGHWAGFGYRGYVIHTGALFGSIMAFNVWFRIWPAQRRIITAVKSGQAPDAALVALAGARSRQNTYMSVPLMWTMVNAHSTWASTGAFAWLYLLAAILLGWWVTSMLFRHAPKIKGF